MNDVTNENLASDSGKLMAKGRVVNASAQWIEVLTQKESGCGGCASSSGCGTGTLSKLFSSESSTPLRIANTLNAKKGDEVTLSMDESDLIKHSFMAYGLPLLGLFIMAALGQWLFFKETQSNLPSVFGGFMGLGLGWWVTRKMYHPTQPKLEQIITEI
jgi:sigma-E factor negative regulatory protein RseC